MNATKGSLSTPFPQSRRGFPFFPISIWTFAALLVGAALSRGADASRITAGEWQTQPGGKSFTYTLVLRRGQTGCSITHAPDAHVVSYRIGKARKVKLASPVQTPTTCAAMGITPAMMDGQRKLVFRGALIPVKEPQT